MVLTWLMYYKLLIFVCLSIMNYEPLMHCAKLNKKQKIESDSTLHYDRQVCNSTVYTFQAVSDLSVRPLTNPYLPLNIERKK